MSRRVNIKAEGKRQKKEEKRRAGSVSCWGKGVYVEIESLGEGDLGR